MVSSADQPASVPPATSTRSIPSGTGTAYQRFWLTKADRCSCHWLARRACSACEACSERSWSAAEPLDPQPLGADPRRSARSPRQIAWPLSAAATRQAAMAGAATTAGTQPAATQAASASAITVAAATASRSGRVMRLSSRRCAASQSVRQPLPLGRHGRRGGGPGSGSGSRTAIPGRAGHAVPLDAASGPGFRRRPGAAAGPAPAGRAR